MAKKGAINHKERKREIRAAGLKLFAQHGFADVNFGMIAEECGIARTLIYTYFKDKRAIFNEAVSEATSTVEAQYREIMRSRQSADAKLRQLCIAVFAMLFDNRDFLCVIVDFLCEFRRKGSIPVDNIMRHTLGLKRIIHSLIVEAKHRGEYDAALDANRATSLIYSQFEVVVLRIAVSGDAQLSDSIDKLNAILLAFRSQNGVLRRFS